MHIAIESAISFFVCDMKKFEFIPHTADVRIKAEGDTLEELFSAALEALCRVMHTGETYPSQDSKVISEEIRLQAPDTTALLVDFLSDALYAMHSNKAILNHISFQFIDQTSLDLVISGSTVDGFHEDIKAVTYHEADVKQTDKGFEAHFILDI